MKPKVYLAGKIGVRDWRWRVSGYADAAPDGYTARTNGWPIAESDNCYITGPYFVRGEGHDGMHGPDEHGTGAQTGIHYENLGQKITARLCQAGIDRCDLFFAWIDAHDAHGTLIELGYAVAKGKSVYVAMPACDCETSVPSGEVGIGGHHRMVNPFEKVWQYPHQCVHRNVWFARAFTGVAGRSGGVMESTASDPIAALRGAIQHWQEANIAFDSPVEKQFWEAHRAARHPALTGLTPQHTVLRYRLDFALPNRKFGVEVDGMAYHNGQDSFIADRRRQRELELAGWRIIRFAAKEVMEDAAGCVRQAAAAASMTAADEAFGEPDDHEAAFADRVERAVREMDTLGLPDDLGVRACETQLRISGVKMSHRVLRHAVELRRSRHQG